MKRILIVAQLATLLLLRGCTPDLGSVAFAQAVTTPPPAIPGNIYIASQYGGWLLYLNQGNTSTGTTSIFVNGYSAVGNIPAFVAGLPITLDRTLSVAETVIPTSVQICNSGAGNCVASQSCSPGSQLCQVFGTFAHTHGQLGQISSGTFGLQEAINVALSQGGGTVLIDPTWTGTAGSGLILAAKGTTAVVIQDNRSGAPQNYQWGGSAYALVATGGGGTPGGSTGSFQYNAGGSFGGVNVTGIPKGNGASAPSTAVGTLGTATGDYSLPFTINCTGTGLTCTPSGTQLQFALSGGAGTGTVQTGAQYQLGGYPVAGSNTTVGPLGGFYPLPASLTGANISTFIASLTPGTGTFILSDGTPQGIGFVNGSWLAGLDTRKGMVVAQLSTFGITCDERQTAVNFTSGSANVVGTFGAADVGKTLIAAGTYSGTQYRFMPTILSQTGSAAVLSTTSPFTDSSAQQVSIGTLNTTALQTAFNAVGGLYPLLAPTGCNMLTDTVLWNSGTSLIAQVNGSFSGASDIMGIPGDDIFQQQDINGVSAGSARWSDESLWIDERIDASKGFTNVSANGTVTVIAPLNRPLASNTPIANNPVGPGWAKNATIGVASTTQGSAVICVPNGIGIQPISGQQIVFPYLPSVITATVSSNSGAGCAGGFSPSTISAALPNTAGYTVSQAEWISTTSIQTSNTALSGTITYPITITLANVIQPESTHENNVSTHGRIRAGAGQEFNYIGTSWTANTITLVSGPASCSGTDCSAGFTVVPVNPCPATYDVPYPVWPTINSGDSTPSGAVPFPGFCGGNAALSFPEANGNVSTQPGLAFGHLDRVTVSGFLGTQSANNTIAMYQAGNTAMYGEGISGFSVDYTTFGIAQGPASYGQHGVALRGPTGTGNHITNCHIHAAYPLIFADFQQSTLQNCDTYTSLVNPVDGTTIGTATAFIFQNTLDEQTGGLVTITAQDLVENVNSEPEGGSHAEIPPYAIVNCYTCQFKGDTFEGGFSIFGGANIQYEQGQLTPTAIDYGQGNNFIGPTGLLQGPTSDIFGVGSFLEWGTNGLCYAPAGGGSGPLISCSAGNGAPDFGQTLDASATGNTIHPYVSPQRGMIRPGEWNTNASFDPNPMTTGFTLDPTEPYWHSYASCNLAGGAICHPSHFDGLTGFVFIGPKGRLVDAPYELEMNVKTPLGANSFFIQVYATDSGNGQCTTPGNPLTNATVPTTAAWTTAYLKVDLTGRAGCIFAVQFQAISTADSLYVGMFNMVPLPAGQILGPSTAPTEGGSCPVGSSWLGAFSGFTYFCDGGTVKRVAIT